MKKNEKVYNKRVGFFPVHPPQIQAFSANSVLTSLCVTYHPHFGIFFYRSSAKSSHLSVHFSHLCDFGSHW